MSAKLNLKTITATSPAAASTVVHAVTFDGLEKYDWFTIDADLAGATGGTLDVYLQRKLASNVWRDWVHFPQLAAAAAAVKYSITSQPASAITVCGGGTDAAPGVALAVNTAMGGHPGQEVRIIFVAGVSTSAGAAQTIRVQCWSNS